MSYTSNKGLSVTWTNLTVSAERNKASGLKSVNTQKEIIHNVDGTIDGGTLVAIMGASGSGKSTLMSVLADRVPKGLRINGSIEIGGKPMGDFIKQISGFVYQDDLFISTLTVFEHLNFTAKLRLDRNMTEETRKELIYEILTELGLLRVANYRIGTSAFGDGKITLSGGERKRLSIATELLTDPSLLFCDEPTTGLDSFTALKVVGNLEYLSKQKRKTIICSIHQPNEEIFRLFQQIILLTAGKIAFSGNCDEAVEFFKDQGFNQAEGQNSADYLVKSLASVGNDNEKADALCLAYKTTEYYVKSKHTRTENSNDDNLDATNMLLRQVKRNGPSWAAKLWYLTHRNLLRINRDTSTRKARIAVTLLEGIIVGGVLGKCVKSTQTGLGIFEGIVYMLCINGFFPAARAALNIFPQQMPIFFREYANSTTTPLIFYISNILSLLPGFILYPIPYTALVYWLTNLTPTYSACVLTFLIITLLFNISSIFGMFMSLACSSLSIAESVALPVEYSLIVLSGLFVKISTTPIFLRWIRYISWIGYAIESLYIIHFHDVNFIRCPRNPNVPCLRNGAQVLASFEFNGSNLWFDIVVLFFIYFFIHLMSYIALLFKIRSKTV